MLTASSRADTATASGRRHAVGIDGRFDHARLVVVGGQLWAGRVQVVAKLAAIASATARWS